MEGWFGLINWLPFHIIIRIFRDNTNSINNLLNRNVVPPVYVAEIDRNNKDQFILILRKSGKALDQIVGCSTELIRLILKEWALIQSEFWYTAEDEEKFKAQLVVNGYDVMTPLHHTVTSMINKKNNILPVEEVVEEVKQVWKDKWEDYHYVLKYFSSQTGMKQLAENALVIDEQVSSGKIFEIVEEGCQVLTSNNRTLNHCDFRLDNMLQVSEESVAFVDFQCIGFGSCGYDLGFFISSCLLSEQVNDNFHNLMESYWNSLICNKPIIEKTYSLEQLKRETRKAAVIQLSLYMSMFSAWRPMIDSGVDLKSAVGRFFELVICATERMLNFHVKFTSSD